MSQNTDPSTNKIFTRTRFTQAVSSGIADPQATAVGVRVLDVGFSRDRDPPGVPCDVTMYDEHGHNLGTARRMNLTLPELHTVALYPRSMRHLAVWALLDLMDRLPPAETEAAQELAQMASFVADLPLSPRELLHALVVVGWDHQPETLEVGRRRHTCRRIGPNLRQGEDPIYFMSPEASVARERAAAVWRAAAEYLPEGDLRTHLLREASELVAVPARSPLTLSIDAQALVAVSRWVSNYYQEQGGPPPGAAVEMRPHPEKGTVAVLTVDKQAVMVLGNLGSDWVEALTGWPEDAAARVIR